MEISNEVKIISMLGDMNNKISDINMNIKDIKERMNKNFALLAEAQVSTNNKLDKIYENIEEIKFRIEVAEAGVGLNSIRIEEFNNVK